MKELSELSAAQAVDVTAGMLPTTAVSAIDASDHEEPLITATLDS